MRSGTQQRFHGTVWDKRVYCGMYVLFSLLFVAYVFNPGKGGVGLRIGVATWICAMLWLAWRGRSAGQVIADDRGVRAYGYIRRWHWAWTELDHFSTDFPLSPVASGHEALVAHTRDGRVTTMSALNASPRRSKSGQPWVREAAAALNHRLDSGD